MRTPLGEEGGGPVRNLPVLPKTLVLAVFFAALLWTAPELMAAQRAGVCGMSTGTQKGDVYSFAIILHEILYRSGLFRCVEDDEYIPPKSKSLSL